MKRLHVIDSHTGGEPTRLIMDGFPALAGATIADSCTPCAANTINGAAPACWSHVAMTCWSARCTARRSRQAPPAG